MKNILKYTTVSVFFFALISCSKKIEHFNLDNAQKHLVQQLNFGPRNPGSEGHQKTKQYIIKTLESHGLDVNTQNFTWYDKRFRKDYPLTNIIASLFKENRKRVLISCHWDTNPIAEKEKTDSLKGKAIPGANDGASGVAALLELARVLSLSDPPAYGIDIVFFDGEDLGDKENPDNYCIGSKKFAEIAKGKYHPYFAINVDMIAGKKPLFKKERYSYYKSRDIVEKVWNVAKESEYSVFFSDKEGDAVNDDHLSLINIGIPAINIIDYNMLNDSSRHHTHRDDLLHIDMKTMDGVMNVLINVLYGD